VALQIGEGENKEPGQQTGIPQNLTAVHVSQQFLALFGQQLQLVQGLELFDCVLVVDGATGGMAKLRGLCRPEMRVNK